MPSKPKWTRRETYQRIRNVTQAALAKLRLRSCIIDGEAVACDDNGVTSFNRVRYRQTAAACASVLLASPHDLAQPRPAWITTAATQRQTCSISSVLLRPAFVVRATAFARCSTRALPGSDPDRTTRRKPTRASAKATWNACVVKLRSASVPPARSRM